MTQPEGITRRYAKALREHLASPDESALHQGYELGRAALAENFGVVDLVILHHDALANLVRESPDSGDSALMASAASFLAESLSPFEMALRGYQDANRQLSASNADLTQANAAVAAAHEALKVEVAERERAEAALIHAQKLQAIGLLAGGIAHHFNNLLSVVLGNLHLARRHMESGEDIGHYLTGAAAGAQRGAEVVKQLLTFSRQQVLETQVIDVAGWLEGATALMASTLRGDINVEVAAASSLWPVRVDPAQLELALLNLAVNARDAMPEGGTLRIAARNRQVEDVRLGLNGDYVVIEVIDTGEGVAPEVMSRIFEPFFTTKEPGTSGGLGLSQVHGFMHQSGGAIDLASTVGKGTTVYLYLPAAHEAVTIVSTESAYHHPAGASGLVLVVDDDIEVADLAGRLLEGCGYTVRLVHRAKAALDLLESGEPIDLLFSDIIMPGGMNGVQLAEEVRRRFPALPILLSTGYSDAAPGAAVKGLPIIAKPYDADALCARLGEILRVARDNGSSIGLR
jgi:signal transduction histidine kinase/ActR/RegA family two-component response regulator